MKKNICIVLSLLIVLTFQSISIKADESDSTFIENSIFNHLVLTDHYKEDNTYSIGKSIRIIECEENLKGLNTVNDEYGYIYPVYENNTLILLSYLIGDTIKTVDVTDEKLISAISENDNVVALMVSGSLYLCNDHELINSTSEVNLQFSIKLSSYLSSQIGNDIYLTEPPIGTLDYSTQSTNATYRLYLPTKGQSPYYNGCWAACIASFDSYYNNTSSTVSSVVHDITGSYNQVSARSSSQVQNYLQYYYDIMVYSRSVNSSFCSNIRSDITSNKAYILLWKQYYYDSLTGSSSTSYHFTILDGYANSGSTYTYYIMDPYKNSSMSGGTYSLSTSSSTTFPTNTSLYGDGTGTVYSSQYFSHIITGAR